MALTVFQDPHKTSYKENQFYQFVIDEFSDTDMNIGLFFDVDIANTHFDCLVLSPKGLAIIEHIDYSGELSGNEFDDWLIEESKGDFFEIANPLSQIKKQRLDLINFFNGDNQKFLNKIFTKKTSDNLDARHISFFLCFNHLSGSSNLLLDKKTSMWFKSVSKKTFIAEFDSLRTSQFTFSLDEIERFSESIDKIRNQKDEENKNNTYCFVCEYSAQKCDKSFVNGHIVDIVDDTITVQSASERFLINYKKSDLTELQLIRDFYLNVHVQMNVRFEINLLHLSDSKKSEKSVNFLITDYTIIVIQPSWLVNVTDFTSLSFCERQAITRQFSRNPINEAILKGISVNEAIKDLIPSAENSLNKDKRIYNAYQSAGQYLRDNIIECGIVGVDKGKSKEEFKDKIKTEIKNIANWTDSRYFQGEPKFEEFVISPELGLRGKLDIVFKQNNEIMDIIELKSSKKDYFTNGIQFYHELQVVAYCMMVMLKQKKSLNQSNPSVIYSKAKGGIETNATLNFETFTNVAKFRNILLNSNIGLKLPQEIDDYHTTHKKKCVACSNNDIYKNISRIKNSNHKSVSQNLISSEKINNFQYWYDFLNSVKIDSYQKYNELMREGVEARKQKGKLIEGGFHFNSQVSNKWKYDVDLCESNQSEFRDKDLVLVMEKENYYNGAAKVAEINLITNSKCEILVNEKFDFSPRFIATYYNDSSDKINNIGLYNAFFNDDKIYRIFYDKIDSAYNDLIRDLDINLILGPPGSGKTTTICNKIIKDIKNGKTVFVMCFTNRALDEIESRLARDRYFSDNNKNIIYRFNRKSSLKGNFKKMSLYDIRVFLSTVHGAKSEIITKWGKKIDVCYIDEASQLNFTMCSNGFLGKKNVLVGDYNQLPPLVPIQLSPKFDTEIIRKSFFEILWSKITTNDIDGRCEYLATQYRMNKEIASYPLSRWYSEFSIQNFEEVENSRLEYPNDSWKNDEYQEILNPDNPSVWVQVDFIENQQDQRINIDEANICGEIINKFVKYGQDINQKIGVIAPFRRQVNEIKNLISMSIEDMDKDLIDTVDRFQGSQKEIIIISICSGQNDNFLETDHRRLNVALTRSKFKRIIVGDINKAGKGLRDILNDGYTKKIRFNRG